MQFASGDEGQWWASELHERMARMLEELRAGPPFPVAGLIDPLLEPLTVGEHSSSNGALYLLSLVAGDGLAPAGPYVEIRTAHRPPPVERGAPWLPLSLGEPLLEDLVVRELERLGGLLDPVAPDIDTPISSLARAIAVDGATVDFDVRAAGDVWAGRAEVPSPAGDGGRLVVTIVSRGVPIEAVALGWIADLAPFLDGRDRWLARLATHLQQVQADIEASIADEPVPAGADALRAIIVWSIDEDSRLPQERARGPRRDRADGARRHRLWRAAVTALAQAWDQDEVQANEQVTSVVNHIAHLSREAAWFATSPSSAMAAVEEIVDHVHDGRAVASVLAHRAWLQYWAPHTEAPRGLRALADDPSPEKLAAWRGSRRSGDVLHDAWLGAWDRWYAERS